MREIMSGLRAEVERVKSTVQAVSSDEGRNGPVSRRRFLFTSAVGLTTFLAGCGGVAPAIQDVRPGANSNISIRCGKMDSSGKTIDKNDLFEVDKTKSGEPVDNDGELGQGFQLSYRLKETNSPSCMLGGIFSSN